MTSVINKEMDLMLTPSFDEACWPIMLIWERINHAYTSDSPPTSWVFRKGDYGLYVWTLNSQNEKYCVVWDTERSYWRVKTPFGPTLYFIGPLFIDKSSRGLHVPPSLTVIASDTDVLRPELSSVVGEQLLKIARFVLQPP